MRPDEEIRREVARLKLEGKTYTQICEELDIPPTAVGRHMRELKRIANDALADDAHCIRLVEEVRLETLYAKFWPLALTGDVRSADLVLRIHAARAKLWGLADLQDAKKPSEIKSKLLMALLADED